MSKTPISILQEMMVKKHIVPNYELIHDGGGTHVNTFTYRVSCDGLIASGTGRSKKDAKHEAAKAMLETIAVHRGYPQLPASPAESPVRTPLPPTIPEVPRIPPNVPFVNAIGALQELCAENNLQEPEYIQISDVGPPHAKIFTIQCRVTSFKETGVARTKKQAKQDAAKKMLDKLTELVPTLSVTPSMTVHNDKMQKMEKDSIDMAKMRYPTLSKLSTMKKTNLGVKLCDYHIQIKNCVNDEVREDIIEKLESITSQKHNVISEEVVKELTAEYKDILQTMGFEMSTKNMPSTNENISIITVKIDTFPEMVQLADGKTEIEAEFNAILKSIDSMIFFLK